MNGCDKHMVEAFPGCVSCYHHLHGRLDGARTEVRRLDGLAEQYAKEKEAANLQNDELRKALKWAFETGMFPELDRDDPKAVEISKMIGGGAEKPKCETFPLCADCGHNHRTEPGHYTTMNCNLKGCPCTYFVEKRICEVPAHEHEWAFPAGTSTASAMVCWCGKVRQ